MTIPNNNSEYVVEPTPTATPGEVEFSDTALVQPTSKSNGHPAKASALSAPPSQIASESAAIHASQDQVSLISASFQEAHIQPQLAEQEDSLSSISSSQASSPVAHLLTAPSEDDIQSSDHENSSTPSPNLNIPISAIEAITLPAPTGTAAPPVKRSSWKSRRMSNKSSKSSMPLHPAASFALPDEEKQTIKVEKIVLCHRTVDFDSLAAAVGLAKYHGDDCYVVIPGGESEQCKAFLGMYAHSFPLLPVKAVDPANLKWIGVVDTQKRERLGVASEWIDYAEKVTVYDHHLGAECDLLINENCELVLESVGAVTTLIAEMLYNAGISLEPPEATLMALAIHADTGSLTFESTTARDARMLAWLLTQGANQRAIAQYIQDPLNTQQQSLLTEALSQMQLESYKGRIIGTVLLHSDEFVKGMATVTQDLLQLSNIDILLLVLISPIGRSKGSKRRKNNATTDESESAGGADDAKKSTLRQVNVIGRARSSAEGVNFHELFAPRGGGGHAKAAALSLKAEESDIADHILRVLLMQLKAQMPNPKTAADIMKRESEIVMLQPEATIQEAANRMQDLQQTIAVVVDQNSHLLGLISQEHIFIAKARDEMDFKVSSKMVRNVFITSGCPSNEAQEALIDCGYGGIPVIDEDTDQVVGVLNSSDLRAVLTDD